jgi:hypothetical protein
VKNTKVVNLGQIRDARALLVEWEKVKLEILAGKVGGFYTVLCDEERREAVFIGGIFKEDPSAGLKAALKLSAARAVEEDEAPQLCTTH